MKLNVGDYVRNRYGIAKIIDIENKNGVDILVFDKNICFLVNAKTEEILTDKLMNKLPLMEHIDLNKIKHSSNIIDLIEEHDFVRMEDRGIRFYEIEKDYQGKLSLRDIGWDEYEELDETNIPEIVSVITHEQMKQMEYKVED